MCSCRALLLSSYSVIAVFIQCYCCLLTVFNDTVAWDMLEKFGGNSAVCSHKQVWWFECVCSSQRGHSTWPTMKSCTVVWSVSSWCLTLFINLLLQVTENPLSRQSLYVKFDPLVKGPSSPGIATCESSHFCQYKQDTKLCLWIVESCLSIVEMDYCYSNTFGCSGNWRAT